MNRAQESNPFEEIEFDYEKKREAADAILKVISGYNLSCNQAENLLDRVKNQLKYVPLWR